MQSRFRKITLHEGYTYQAEVLLFYPVKDFVLMTEVHHEVKNISMINGMYQLDLGFTKLCINDFKGKPLVVTETHYNKIVNDTSGLFTVNNEYSQ